jgi:hypothetical protein
MSDVNQTIRQRSNAQRGSALLMALVITVILFIMGLMFVSTTQTEKSAVSGLEEQNTLETGIDTVIDRINTVLVDDLFGGDGNMLNGTGDSTGFGYDEYWDYPGPDDPWLASLEPLWNSDINPLDPRDDYCVWLHITDLYGNNFDPPAYTDYCYSPADRSNPNQWDYTMSDSLRYRVTWTSDYVVGRIISDDEGTETIRNIIPPLTPGDWNNKSYVCLWGAQADADGDGVADSRWVKVPNITGPQGQNVYTAVRIIDNGSMINVNTAYRDPTLVGGDWDGSRLSHVSLEGGSYLTSTQEQEVKRISESVGVEEFQGVRYGMVGGNPMPNTVSAVPGGPAYLDFNIYDNDLIYDEGVSQRILNPAVINVGGTDYHFTPFDLTDELEFRNRFFINNLRLLGRTELTWPVTFVPGGGYTKNEPYVLPNEISNWFNKAANVNSGFYTRRHICTAYSFDRIIRPYNNSAYPVTFPLPGSLSLPNGQRKASISPPIIPAVGLGPGTIEGQTLEQLAGAIYMGLPNDIIITDRFGTEYTRESLAWQFAVNLVDYQDQDTDSVPTAHTVGTTTYFGVEDVDGLKQDTLLISKIGYINVDDAVSSPSAPATANGMYYAIEVFNPDDTHTKDLAEYEIVMIGATTVTAVPLPAVALSPDETSALLFTSTGGDPTIAFASRTNISTPPNVVALPDLAANDQIIIRKIDYPTTGINMPVDCVTVQSNMLGAGANVVDIWERTEKLPLSDTNFLLPADSGGGATYNPWVSSVDIAGPKLGDSITPTNASLTGIDKVQLVATRESLRNLGEIEKVMAVGFSYDTATGANKCKTLWQGIVDSQAAIKAPGPTSDQELLGTAIEMGSFGKIRLDNPDYQNLMNFLTYFDLSNDGVDNDGDLMTSDNPMYDWVDQDGDHVDIEPSLVGTGTPPYTAGPDVSENLAQYYEQMIAGRININTAPWFVIKQLPWLGLMTQTVTPFFAGNSNLAQGIVAFRDKLDLSPIGPNYSGPTGRSGETNIAGIDEYPGFKNIAQLLQVITTTVPLVNPAIVSTYDIRQYLDTWNIDPPTAPPTPKTGPDYTSDSAEDDLEERDVLFHRVSNLVTVRSDVFTAYILVRVGERGPQRRVIAIFDRSNVFSPADRPKLVALHPVPDPR